MVDDNSYIIAYSQVDCLLNYLPNSYIDRIPVRLRELIKNNSSSQYAINIDINNPLSGTPFSDKAKDLIAVLKYNYWSTQEEKDKLKELFNKNETIYQNNINKKYSVDNLFNNARTTQAVQSKTMVEYKETFLQN